MGIWSLADPNKLDRIKCLLCEKVMSGGVKRLKHHIAHIMGNVAPCPKATKDDQIKCRNAINEVKCKKKGKQDDDDTLREDMDIGSNEPIDVDEMEETFGSLKSPRSFGPMDRFVTNPEDVLNKGKSKQVDLSNVVRKEK